MQITGVSSCAAALPAVSQDLQVKGLLAKIQDWATCPTTDPQTKKEIVGRLQGQLDAAVSSIERREEAKQPDERASTIDLRA